jgi:hypothetical protein
MVNPHRESRENEKQGAAPLLLLLLTILIAVYSLTYSGTFVTDDEHLLSSRAISLAFDNTPNQSRVIGNSRVYQYSIVNPLAAQQAENIEPAQGFLGAILVRLSLLLNSGRVQTVFILNIWTTAFAAAMIYLTLLKKRYRSSTSFLLGILFGLCTIAFPYSKTFFRDSLAMAFVACAWYFTARIEYKARFRLSDWILWMVSICLAVLSKNTALIAAPVLLLEIYIGKRDRHKGKLFQKRRTWLILVFVVLILLVLWIFLFPRIPLFSRFSPAYYFSLLVFFISTPHPQLIQALAGPLVSPGKSLFVFSPILLISLVSLVRYFRSSWSSYLYLLFLIIAQALFYDNEWAAHINWGLRYVLPAIPGLIIAEAPVVEKLLSSLSGKISLGILAIFSAFIQLLGVLVPVTQYFVDCATSQSPVTEPMMTWGTSHSILKWSLTWILSGNPVNLALDRNDPMGIVVVSVSILTALLCVFAYKNKVSNILRTLPFILIMAISVLLPVLYKNDPDYFRSRTDFSTSQKYIADHQSPGDLILLKSYGNSIWEYWMNWTGPDLKWTALPFTYPGLDAIERFHSTGDPQQAMDAATLAILEKETHPLRQVWLVLPSDTPGADLGIEESWLSKHSDQAQCVQFSGEGQSTRVCRYHIKPWPILN